LPWESESQLTENHHILEFLAGEDVLLDREIFSFDIQATIAHVNGLQRIDILDESEVKKIVTCLNDLSGEFATGEFILDSRYEDGHSAIEMYVTEKLGSLGGMFRVV